MDIERNDIIELMMDYWYEHSMNTPDLHKINEYLKTLKRKQVTDEDILAIEELVTEYASLCEHNAFFGAFDVINLMKKVI